MEKRVVVTGIGVVSPVGNNVDAMWESIKAGKHGIAEITRFDLEGHKVTLAAEVKDFDFGDRRAAKRLDIADQYALVAAREAVEDSGIVRRKRGSGSFRHIRRNGYRRHLHHGT